MVKEGRRSCLSEAGGRDIFDRLDYQRDIHRSFGTTLAMPRFVDLFTEAGNRYLVLSFVAGVDMDSLPPRPFRRLKATHRQQRLALLLSLSRMVARVHAAGLVHRDITPRNVRIAPDFASVSLIDYELSCVVTDSYHRPFAGVPRATCRRSRKQGTRRPFRTTSTRRGR